MKITVGSIGLGHIGRHHLEALKQLADFEVAAVCDKNSQLAKLAPTGVKFYQNHSELLKNSLIETVIIATPNHTHLMLVEEVLNSGKNAILEKPAVSNEMELKQLNLLTKQYTHQHVYYAFHAAQARDVCFFKEYYSNHKKELGDIIGFASNFYDPYFDINGRLLKQAQGLQNPWIDSGVNALSVLGQFIDIPNIKPLQVTVDRIKNNVSAVLIHYQFENTKKKIGYGHLHTSWATGKNHKQTRLFFTKTSDFVTMDHSLEKVFLTTDNKTRVLKNLTTKNERLTNHYLGVFSDYLHCYVKKSFNGLESKKIHQKLFSITV